jgi:branched-chain amino acid transport system permease protein
MPSCISSDLPFRLAGGLSTGSIYALIALGYTLVYGVLRLINFAHSEVFMSGTLVGFLFLNAIVPSSGLASDAAGGGVLLIALIPGMLAAGLVAVFINSDVVVFVVALAMMISLELFVRRTRTGRSIRAVAQDAEAAALMGVSIDRVITITFLIGGLLAGAAGILFGYSFGRTRFDIGFLPGIKAFTAAVLGGIGSIRGALAGGLLLGVIENVGAGCFGSQWRDVIAFVILVGVLMFRPTGVFGESM